MKLFFGVFLLIAAQVSAQKHALPNPGMSGIKKTDLGFIYIFNYKTGIGKPDSVDILVDKEIINNLHAINTDLFLMVSVTSRIAKESLVEKSSYEVNQGEDARMTLSMDNNNRGPIITITWYYLGQNVYGAKKSLSLYTIFGTDYQYHRTEFPPDIKANTDDN